jgi:protein phosphatase
MPWSAKAQELLQKQYAPVGNAGVRGLQAERDIPVGDGTSGRS